MDLGTVLGSKLATAVRINQLLVPANSITRHLLRYTDPALFHSKGFGKYNMTKAGSLTRLKQSSRYFALITHHQLSTQNYEYDQLTIHNPETQRLVNSEMAIFELESEKSEYNFDCVLFEFTKPVKAGMLSEHGWYDLTQELTEEKLSKPSGVIAIGYPSHRNEIDYETDQYSMAPNSVFGYESTSSLEYRLAFDPEPEIEFDPQGMSGGPVFGISIENLEPEVFFAGIITNASRKKFHFLSRNRISSLISELD